MTDRFVLDQKNTALLLMDFQVPIVENFSADRTTLLNRTAEVLHAARNAGMMVIYVVVGFRPGYPEVSDRNRLFRDVKKSGAFSMGSDLAEIHPVLAPLSNEPTVMKHRVGAFGGTALDMILRANGIETLLLCGISTSGVVLSTLRHAADADYRLVVIQDCCSDTDAEVHRVLIEKVFPRQAVIATASEIVGALLTN